MPILYKATNCSGSLGSTECNNALWTEIPSTDFPKDVGNGDFSDNMIDGIKGSVVVNNGAISVGHQAHCKI
jgi:hypothetical protein